MTNEQENQFEDLLDSIEAKDFFRRARTEMFPKMKGSLLCLTILDSEADVKLCLEIGAALLFDKPLIILLKKGRTIPERLCKLADSVIGFDSMADPEVQAHCRAAIQKVVEREKGRRG